MTFEELDQRTILWNQIANGHRDTQQRINTQIHLCHEEMNKEFFHWLGNRILTKPLYDIGVVMTELLDGYADSRFVFIEFSNLSDLNYSTEIHIFDLFEIVEKYSNKLFNSSILIEAYRRVIESNFSKFVKADETHDVVWAQNEADEMSAPLGVTEKITIELSHGYWVFRDQNGKIRKPSTFQPVDLSDLV